MPSPLQFSVVTPSWNQGAYLAGCIESVRAQGRADLEHIVIDNCSTDGTAEILRAHPELHAVVEPDRGQSEALNKGFARARGEVIAWLNADDRYLPGALDRVADAFRDAAVQVVYGHVMVRDETKCVEFLKRARLANRCDFLTWSGVKLHQPAIFFRRSALAAVGPLRMDLHFTMDMELWWRLSARFAFTPIDQPLAVQVYHASAKSVRAAADFIEERKRIFGPLLWRHPGGWLLWPERQRNIARRYLSLAREPGGTSALWARAVLAYPPSVLAWLRSGRDAQGGVVASAARGDQP